MSPPESPLVRRGDHDGSVPESENVVARLRRANRLAWELGFEVRTVLLDDAEPSWCQIGRQKVILLDLAHPAAEQLAELERILSEVAPPVPSRDTPETAAA